MPQDVATVDQPRIKNKQYQGAMPTIAAGETTVSATLVDLGGTPWKNAPITINFVPAPNIPGPYMWQGGTFSLRPQLVADGNGHFSITLPDNTTITPAGSMWQFVIAPNATMPAVIFQLQAAGSSMDISGIFTAQSYQVSLGIVQALPLPRAYQDSDVAAPQNPGALYYDSTQHQVKLFTSGHWHPLFGGGWTQVADGTNADTLSTGIYFAANGFQYNPPFDSNQISIPMNVVLTVLGPIQFCFAESDRSNQLFRRTWSTAFNQWTDWGALPTQFLYRAAADADLWTATNSTFVRDGFTANGPPTSNSTNAFLEIFATNYDAAGQPDVFIQRCICPMSDQPTKEWIRVYNSTTSAWSAWA